MSPDLRLNINVRNITGLDKSYDINKSVPIEHYKTKCLGKMKKNNTRIYDIMY